VLNSASHGSPEVMVFGRKLKGLTKYESAKYNLVLKLEDRSLYEDDLKMLNEFENIHLHLISSEDAPKYSSKANHTIDCWCGSGHNFLNFPK